jgi:hypothetical protein
MAMTLISLHTPVPTRPALPPVLLAFPTRRLLTGKSSATVEPGTSGAQTENLTLRAAKITVILKEIQGYSHWGLNE